jgi:hypothetical protein
LSETGPSRWLRRPVKKIIVQQNITPHTLTGFDACARSLHNHCTVLQWQVTDRFKLVFSPISPRFHYLHACAAVQQTGSNLFSFSYVDLLHDNQYSVSWPSGSSSAVLQQFIASFLRKRGRAGKD